ncbi:TetR/AcrR family transcriptional regulator [soil metagenome]
MTPSEKTSKRSARERLLASADELFNEAGIHTIGIDRVLEHAGVAKASLYDTFGSKDELIRAYLLSRHDARQARIAARLDGVRSPRDRILAIFDSMADLFADPKFRGCAFLRASAEARPDSCVTQVVADYRGWLLDLFERLATDAGVTDPKRLAQQLAMLYDGASVSAQMDGRPGAAAQARAMAAMLLDADAFAAR